MPISRVQATGNNSGASNSPTSITGTFGSNTTAHNHLVALLYVTTTGGTITPPSGDTWQLATSIANANGSSQDTLYIYYAENIAGGQTAYQFQVNSSTSLALSMFETSGLATSGSLDKTKNAANAATTSPDTGTTATTTQANELWIGGYGAASTQTYSSPNNSFNLERQDKTSGATRNATTGLVYKIVSATGTADCTSTMSAARDNAGVIATFGTTSATTTSTTTTSTSTTTSTTMTMTSTSTSSTSTSTTITIPIEFRVDRGDFDDIQDSGNTDAAPFLVEKTQFGTITESNDASMASED